MVKTEESEFDLYEVMQRIDALLTELKATSDAHEGV